MKQTLKQRRVAPYPKMDPVEKEFYKFIPQWIYDIRRVYNYGERLRYENDYMNYKWGIVGEMRKLMGLERDPRPNPKKPIEEQPDICNTCQHITELFGDAYYINVENRHPCDAEDREQFRSDYLALLFRLKLHIENYHKVMFE
jgi:hypothetical protein